MGQRSSALTLVYCLILTDRTFSYSSDDENWVSSILLDSPRSGTSFTNVNYISDPSKEVPIYTVSVRTVPSLEKTHLATKENPIISTSIQVKTPRKKVSTYKNLSEEVRQRLLSEQRIRRQKIKDQGGEIEEALKARQRDYNKKSRLKLREDPIKLEEFRKYHRLASKRTYERRKNDPVAFAAFKKLKTERSTKRKQMLRDKDKKST